MNRHHIAILMRNERRLLFRSPQGILAASLLLVYAGWILSKLWSNADFINGLGSGNLGEDGTIILAAFRWVSGISDEVLGRLLAAHSPFVTLLFVMVAFLLPLFSIVAALDQNASDIGQKGIRFYLPRTGRTELLLGRFLGTAQAWTVVLAVLGAIGTLTALLLDKNHGAGTVLQDGLWMTAGLLLLALPCLAFMSLCAVTTGNPLLSATMGIGCYLAVAFLGGVGGWIHGALKAIRYLFPFPLRYDLMLGGPLEVTLAAAAMLAYSGVYLVGASAVFARRDL